MSFSVIGIVPKPLIGGQGGGHLARDIVNLILLGRQVNVLDHPLLALKAEETQLEIEFPFSFQIRGVKDSDPVSSDDAGQADRTANGSVSGHANVKVISQLPCRIARIGNRPREGGIVNKPLICGEKLGLNAGASGKSNLLRFKLAQFRIELERQ